MELQQCDVFHRMKAFKVNNVEFEGECNQACWWNLINSIFPTMDWLMLHKQQWDVLYRQVFVNWCSIISMQFYRSIPPFVLNMPKTHHQLYTLTTQKQHATKQQVRKLQKHFTNKSNIVHVGNMMPPLSFPLGKDNNTHSWETIMW